MKIMFKNFNNIWLKRRIVLLLRIVLMMILINYLLSTAVQKQDAVIFFKRELISIFSYNDYSEANLEIPKLLLNLSLFMVGWLSVILLESDLADHYHHLIRYQSSSFSIIQGNDWLSFLNFLLKIYLSGSLVYFR